MKIVNVTQNNQLFENRILIENTEDLNQYFKEYIDLRFEDITVKTLLRKDEDIDLKSKDPIKRLSDMAIIKQKSGGGGALWNIAEIESKVKLAMIKYCCKGYILMVNPAGGWNIVSENAIIEYLTETTYSKEDIKISRWPNGKHFYAKIKNIDVIDEQGNVKWNFHYRAQCEAEKFLKKLNKTK